MDPGIRYADKKLHAKIFLKNFCLSTKFDKFFLIKNQKSKKNSADKIRKIIGAISILLGKNFIVAIKKMLVIQYSYKETV